MTREELDQLLAGALQAIDETPDDELPALVDAMEDMLAGGEIGMEVTP